MSKERRSRGSFSDLAKLAGTPPPPAATPSASVTPPPAAVQRGTEAGSDDSGIVDFKMIASLDPLAEERAKSTPLADQGLFDEDEKKAAPVAAAAAAVPSVAPSSAKSFSAAPVSSPPASASSSSKSSTAPAAAAAVPAASGEKKKSGSGGTIAFLFGGVVLVGAVAAGALFYVKNHELPFMSKPKVADVAPPKPTAPAVTTTAPAPTDTVAQNDTQQTSPDIAPDPASTTKPGVKGPIAKANPGGGLKQPPPGPTADPKLTVKDLPPSQGGTGTGLSEAMKNVVGPIDTSQNTQPAAGGGGQTGNVPQKPSQGMVQGAVNAVLPSARTCLGPDDPVSKATVVFQSDGTVQSVAVTGSASGKPAEQCIKNALSKAKVQPFAEPTFSFPVTVRPNG